jgi:two-component system, LytTR family, response regulator AlgR
MRVLIVDDEALARLRLRGLLQALPELAIEAIGEAADGEEVLRQVQQAPSEAPWDLLLLDIRMPGPSRHMGLRLAARLRAMAQPPAVVFVSAHAEHALAAFDLDAVDYLTKPVRRERLLAALQRVQQRLAARSGGPSTQAAELALLADAPALVVSERGRVLRLPLPEVLYLKAEQKYVTLHTATHNYLLDETLAELEARLADLGGPPFIRVHRNSLVARHAVRALALREGQGGEDGNEGWAVRVAPLDEWLAVSRRQLAAVRAALVA